MTVPLEGRRSIKEALPIPKEITPLLLVAMGYPAYEPQPLYRLPPEEVVRLVI